MRKHGRFTIPTQAGFLEETKVLMQFETAMERISQMRRRRLAPQKYIPPILSLEATTHLPVNIWKSVSAFF